MHLRGSAVDFIGQHEIGEDRPEVRDEPAILRLKDHRADHVARQQIRGELDPLEAQAEGGAKAAHQEGFGEAGHALEQDVSIGQQRHQESFNNRGLTNHGATDLGRDFFRPRMGWIHGR